MRTSLIAALSCAALTAAAAAPALAASQSPAPAAPQAAAQAGTVSDAELRSFATAMQAIQPIAEAAAGAPPTPEQQASMAAAIEASGLPLERFNAISTAVSADAVLRARLQLAATDPSPAGSPAAAVTDAEVEQFVVAMTAVQPIAESLNGAAPSAEQQAAMAAAITGSGLELERFNAISGAVSQDAHLRARMAVADARRNS
jgi:predicted transcriptional regulator